MFDIGWSELLIFAVVTLILVGPKELPVLMRTVGRYAGMVRRHADEFRRQFDAAMQDAEIDQMQAELESVSKDLGQSLDDTKLAIEDPALARGEGGQGASKDSAAKTKGADVAEPKTQIPDSTSGQKSKS